jgi:hypothetical protein
MRSDATSLALRQEPYAAPGALLEQPSFIWIGLIATFLP